MVFLVIILRLLKYLKDLIDECKDKNVITIINVLLDKGISYVIKDIFTDKSNQTSLGFDYANKNYYSVEMNIGKPEFVLEYSFGQMSK